MQLFFRITKPIIDFLLQKFPVIQSSLLDENQKTSLCLFWYQVGQLNDFES